MIYSKETYSRAFEILQRATKGAIDNDSFNNAFKICESKKLDIEIGDAILQTRWNSKKNLNEVALIVSIDLMRQRAEQTGLHLGISIAPLYDNGKFYGTKGILRKWNATANMTAIYECEILASEYSSGFIWGKLLETMTKKVNESHLLRMAYSMELAGLYINDEIRQPQQLPDKEIDAQIKTEFSNPVPPKIKTSFDWIKSESVRIGFKIGAKWPIEYKKIIELYNVAKMENGKWDELQGLLNELESMLNEYIKELGEEYA